MPSPQPQPAGATVEPWHIILAVLVIIALIVVGLVKLIRRR
jgi:hypothetical protein